MHGATPRPSTRRLSSSGTTRLASLPATTSASARPMRPTKGFRNGSRSRSTCASLRAWMGRATARLPSSAGSSGPAGGRLEAGTVVVMGRNMVPHGYGCNMLIRRAASGGHRMMAAGRWPLQQVLQAQLPPVHLQSTQAQSVHGHAVPVGVAASTAGESLRSLETFMGLDSMIAAECRDAHTGACPRGKVNRAFFRARVDHRCLTLPSGQASGSRDFGVNDMGRHSVRPELADARQQGFHNIGEASAATGVSAKMIRAVRKHRTDPARPAAPLPATGYMPMPTCIACVSSVAAACSVSR